MVTNDNRSLSSPAALADAAAALEVERQKIQSEREALLAAAQQNSMPSDSTSALLDDELDALSASFTNLTPPAPPARDEDDIVIEQLTAQLQQLQALLIEQQAASAAQQQQNAQTATNLTNLVNAFLKAYASTLELTSANEHQLQAMWTQLQAQHDAHELDHNLLQATYHQALQDQEVTHTMVSDLEPLVEQIKLAIEHLSPNVVQLMQPFAAELDALAAGLVPPHLLIKTHVQQCFKKLDRASDRIKHLTAQLKQLVHETTKPIVPPPMPVAPVVERQVAPAAVIEHEPGFKTFEKPEKLHGWLPLSDDAISAEPEDDSVSSPDFINNFNDSDPSTTALAALNNDKLETLTNQIEKIKDNIQKENADLVKINAEREAKWQAFFEQERTKYESLLGEIRKQFQTVLASKRERLVDTIGHKIENKTSQILDTDATVDVTELEQIYHDIATNEEHDFNKTIKTEQTQFEKLLENERKRFEAIIALKAREWSQEKEMLIAEKNHRLQELQTKMDHLRTERDRLLEEKNALLIDLQNLTKKTYDSNNSPQGPTPELTGEPVAPFAREEFTKLNELRAASIDKEIKKAEVAQQRAQVIYEQFEKQRVALQENLKQAHERNSIDKLTKEITERIATKFDDELKKIKAQAAPHNAYTIPPVNQQPAWNPALVDYQAPAPSYDPTFGYFQPQNQNPQNSGEYYESLPANFDQPVNGAPVTPTIEPQPKTPEPATPEVAKPLLRKAAFLKTADAHGRLSSEQIRKYANAIISANRKKQQAS